MAFKAFLTVVLIAAIGLAVSGYALMLGIGVAFHQGIIPSTADYFSSVAMALVLGFVVKSSVSVSTNS